MKTWMVERWVCNKWEVGAKDSNKKIKVTPLFQVKAWLIRRVHEIRARDAIATLLLDAKKHSLKSLPKKYKNKSSGLYEIDMPDIHLGRQTWEEESGENSDLKIMVGLVKVAMTDLLSRIENTSVSRILFPIGNDFFNVNDKREETIHGTRQQEDQRWQKTFREGRKLLVTLVDMCVEVAPVDVLVIPGNHDEERIFYMGDALDCWYHNNKNVSIDNRAVKRKYYQFEKNLIGFTHGYYEKPEKLAYLMPSEVPALWAKTINREWHLGDKHQKKDTVYYKTTDGNGIMVRILRSLAAPDAWTFDKGFISSPRAAEAFMWHPENGVSGQFTHVVK
ncbi:MAG: hypothetical protein NUV61_03830 [Candidatus Azambacteria bacterium]|nr:hypothetical protein [Candidatus Azambacteria bacterium]